MREIDSEERLLQKNANQRKWYAQLPQGKTDDLLQNKRTRYAALKRPTTTDQQNTEAGENNQQACSNEISDKNEANTMTNIYENELAVSAGLNIYSKQMTSTYDNPNKGITIKDTATEDLPLLRRQRELKNYTSCKGKAKISLYSSFDTAGLQSTCASEMIPSTKQTTQFTQGSNKRGEDVLKTIFDTPSIFPLTQPCKYCAARRFYHEPKGFCCSSGEVSLVANTVPKDLYDLYTSESKNSNEFRTYIRTYNNTFAFTSFGVKYDKELCKRNKGIYTFKIQGQVYHYINEIVPTNNEPTYLQLYFYDTEHETTNRTNQSNKLNASIFEQIMNILKLNPYATFFRSLRNVTNLSEREIIIKADAGLDERVFNSPTSSRVAAIWHEITESTKRRSRDIVVYNYSDYKHKVEYFYGCHDPLQYPLLFPYGEPGWHHGIERVNKDEDKLCGGQSLVAPRQMKSANELLTKEARVLSSAKKNPHGVSCREYYCYKLQIRPNDNSVLLRAGRLLQQYVVDMYAKLETSRLDYFRYNQEAIRAEVY